MTQSLESSLGDLKWFLVVCKYFISAEVKSCDVYQVCIYVIGEHFFLMRIPKYREKFLKKHRDRFITKLKKNPSLPGK